jgi:hypothetical protein
MSAWRQPMVWLAIALPAASVVASVALLVIAGGDGFDRVADSVQRTALVLVFDLSADLRAHALGLQAIARMRDGAIEVRPVSGTFDATQSLTLVLHHPIDAARDRRFELAPVRGGWVAQGDVDAAHAWNATLSARDATWRMQGRWRAGDASTRLTTAIP